MLDGQTIEYPRNLENNSNTNQLERLVVQAAKGEFLDNAEFPSVISAGDIETYANWLSDLTLHHPQHHEFGAVPHVKTTKGRIIYPSNPASGLNGVGWAVSRERTVNIPTVSIHSHPNNWSFSQAGGDLGTFFSGFGKGVDFFLPTSVMVSTYELNYLLLMSKETPRVERFTLAHRISNVYPYERFAELRRFGTKAGKLIDNTDFYWKMFNKVNQDFFYGNFDNYFFNLMNAFIAADIYASGFYISYKDGRYIRINDIQQAEKIVMDSLEVAFSKCLS